MNTFEGVCRYCGSMINIMSVQIGFDHSSIRIWKTGDKIKVKRTAKVETTRET